MSAWVIHRFMKLHDIPYTVAAMTSLTERPIRTRRLVAIGNICRCLLPGHDHKKNCAIGLPIPLSMAIYRRDTPLVRIELSTVNQIFVAYSPI